MLFDMAVFVFYFSYRHQKPLYFTVAFHRLSGQKDEFAFVLVLMNQFIAKGNLALKPLCAQYVAEGQYHTFHIRMHTFTKNVTFPKGKSTYDLHQ